MTLSELLNSDVEARDLNWEQSFLNAIPHSTVKLDNETPTQEFDGWPYLHVSTVSNMGTDPAEPMANIIQWLSERGIGLIVNSYKSEPDYVFSYGMLWSLRARGKFIGDLSLKSEGSLEFNPSNYKSVGEPTDTILPPYVRKVLRQFFADQGILTPKILVASEDNRNFDFCFSIESLGYPPESEHKGILEALSWFFPPDYSLMLVKESSCDTFSAI